MPYTAFEKGWLPYVVLSVLCLAFFIPGMASIPPLDRDESRFAQATTQMLESGDYVQIRYQDEMRAKKPVGAYWVQAASVSLVSSADAHAIWAYRLPSALAAWGSIMLLFSFGRSLVGTRPALLGAALFGASLMVVLEAHQAKTDALLLLSTVMTMGALGRLYLQDHGGKRPGIANALLLWGGLGCGILLKGPVVPMVAGLTILALIAADRSVRWMRTGFYFLPGIILTAAITVPWFIAIQSATGGDFLGTAIKTDLLPKLIGGQESHGGWPGYYFLLLSVMFWPASLFVWPAVVRGWFLRRHAAIRFFMAWLVPSWIVFELIPTKLPHYVLPLYPALALLIGAAIAAEDGWLHKRGARIWYLVWALIGLILAGASLYASHAFGAGIGVGAVAAAGLALVAGVFPAFLAWKGRVTAAAVCAVVIGGATLALVMGAVLPGLEKLALSPRLEAAVRESGARLPIAISGYHEPSLVFLLGTKTQLVNAVEAARYLVGNPDTVAIIAQGDVPAFEAEMQNLGKKAAFIKEVSGFNYSRGKNITLKLYRLEGA